MCSKQHNRVITTLPMAFDWSEFPLHNTIACPNVSNVLVIRSILHIAYTVQSESYTRPYHPFDNHQHPKCIQMSQDMQQNCPNHRNIRWQYVVSYWLGPRRWCILKVDACSIVSTLLVFVFAHPSKVGRVQAGHIGRVSSQMAGCFG